MPEFGSLPPAHTHYDVVVIGAGAAGMTAACVAASKKLRVLLVEKAAQVGGTTAISGGMVWLPANGKMAEAGIADSLDDARRYLELSVPGAATSPVLGSFLIHADEALRYLESRTEVRLRPVQRYPDYYPDREGATAGGRVLEPLPFDGIELGRHFALLAPPLPEFTMFGGMMINRQDIPHLRRVGRSIRSTWRVLGLLIRHAGQRLHAPRGTALHLGNALAGRLLLSCLKLGVTLSLSTTCSVEAAAEGNGAWRITLSGPEGRQAPVEASRAVVIATGGFSHDPNLRSRYLPSAAGNISAASPLATGDGIRQGEALGGHIGGGESSAAFWVPGSQFIRADGTAGVFPHTVTDRAKPGMIALDRHGHRFTNEAVSYHEFVLAMLRNGNAANPCYLVCDSRALWKYGLGRIKPFALSVREDVASGYLLKANTIGELAEKLGLDPGETARTLERYNAGARSGEDPEFGRGENIYQRHLGDADQEPNPCVAPIERAPFYAITLHPADLGTAIGLATDGFGRVLDKRNEPITGLYACGNDMSSAMQGAYPGPGITLGPALTFGFLAASHIAAADGPEKEARDAR